MGLELSQQTRPFPEASWSWHMPGIARTHTIKYRVRCASQYSSSTSFLILGKARQPRDAIAILLQEFSCFKMRGGGHRISLGSSLPLHASPPPESPNPWSIWVFEKQCWGGTGDPPPNAMVPSRIWLKASMAFEKLVLSSCSGQREMGWGNPDLTH